MTETIRPYGPGKFNTIVDSVVWELPCERDCGSLEEDGIWYGRIDGPLDLEALQDGSLPTLNEAERAQIAGTAGIIVSENTQGCVDVEYYDSAEDLEDAWRRCLEETSPEPSEPDEDEITTEDHRHFYCFRRCIVTVGDDDEWQAAVKAWMEKEQYWPNVWFISDHGNAHLLSLDKD